MPLPSTTRLILPLSTRREPSTLTEDPAAEKPGSLPATTGTRLVRYLVPAWTGDGARQSTVAAQTWPTIAQRVVMAFSSDVPRQGVIRCASTPCRRAQDSPNLLGGSGAEPLAQLRQFEGSTLGLSHT